MDNTVSENTEKKTIEVKQSFFSSAISDISAYIQLVDTKVSIIMAAVVAIIMGGVACYELIENLIPRKALQLARCSADYFDDCACSKHCRCVCLWNFDNS